MHGFVICKYFLWNTCTMIKHVSNQQSNFAYTQHFLIHTIMDRTKTRSFKHLENNSTHIKRICAHLHVNALYLDFFYLYFVISKACNDHRHHQVECQYNTHKLLRILQHVALPQARITNKQKKKNAMYWHLFLSWKHCFSLNFPMLCKSAFFLTQLSIFTDKIYIVNGIVA